MKKIKKDHKGYTLIEVVFVMAISAIIVTASTFALFVYRNNVLYDVLSNQIIASINSAQIKAKSALLKDDLRVSQGVIFFENRLVEFSGSDYVEGDDCNVEYNVPTGFSLGTTCSPTDNGVVLFSPIRGEGTNTCTIDIYKYEDTIPTGTITVGKFGIEGFS